MRSEAVPQSWMELQTGLYHQISPLAISAVKRGFWLDSLFGLGQLSVVEECSVVFWGCLLSSLVRGDCRVCSTLGWCHWLGSTTGKVVGWALWWADPLVRLRGCPGSFFRLSSGLTVEPECWLAWLSAWAWLRKGFMAVWVLWPGFLLGQDWRQCSIVGWSCSFTPPAQVSQKMCKRNILVKGKKKFLISMHTLQGYWEFVRKIANRKIAIHVQRCHERLSIITVSNIIRNHLKSH